MRINSFYYGSTAVGAYLGSTPISDGGTSPVDNWILALGVWNDEGVWNDASLWKDAA
jgi:hypothetical protein